MRSVDFCYWLQGSFELSEPNTPLTEKQVQIIKNHLKLVFLYDIDPSYSDDPKVQRVFQNIHDGKEPLDGVDTPSASWPDLSSTRPNRNNNGSNDGLLKC